MAWYLFSTKPLPEPMMIQFTVTNILEYAWSGLNELRLYFIEWQTLKYITSLFECKPVKHV